MRVLTLVDDLDRGGVQRGALDYARGYDRQGHESAVLVSSRGGLLEAEARSAGLPLFLGDGADREARRAAAWTPDVIHVHSWGPLSESEGRAIEGVLRHSERRPMVIETASFGKIDYGRRFDVVDVTLLLSKWALWRWRKWTRPFSPRPLGAVVPITVDPTTFYPDPGPFRAEHAIPEGAVLIGSIARPDPIKWHPLLTGAAVAVAADRPDVYLAFVGPTEAARQRLASAPDDVVRRTTILPALTDDGALRAAYSALDVLLHASPIGETFGLVFLEALACGTPIATLATPHKNNSQLEVVGHGRGGLVAANARRYLSNVRRLAGDAGLRDRLSREGREYVLRTFTVDRVIPRVIEIAEAFRTEPTREEGLQAVRGLSGLTTDVGDEEIRDSLSVLDGSIPLHRRLAMRLVHVPTVHRAMVAWQRRRWA